MHENWFKELKKNKLHKIVRIKKEAEITTHEAL